MARHYNKFVGRVMGLVLALSLCGAATSTAHANLTVCNRTTGQIWYSHTIPRSSCGSGWAQVGWFNIPANSCGLVFAGNVAAQMPSFFYYAFASDYVWGNNGNTFFERITAHDDCYENVQLSCQNPNSGCWQAGHRVATVRTFDATISFSK